ncbi:hypothetical protein [Lactococcus lactis]|uniref:hypothetical protein n=1 Tax=Lactococcus lactis TaxID=1358 RepID=UPI00289248B7|nr:hypothetical protein [Lactococcus lactis]MDT2902716.1 hypothetical protein [Lactococcus lactis]
MKIFNRKHKNSKIILARFIYHSSHFQSKSEWQKVTIKELNAAVRKRDDIWSGLIKLGDLYEAKHLVRGFDKKEIE